MKKVVCFLIFCGLLFGFLQVSIDRTIIPLEGSYNPALNVMITLGMPKHEVDALLGESEFLDGRTDFYFNDDPKNRIAIQYDYASVKVLSIRVYSSGWRVYEPSCYVGADVLQLPEHFEGSYTNKWYRCMFDKDGQPVSLSEWWDAICSIDARFEDGRIAVVFVGKPSIKL